MIARKKHLFLYVSLPFYAFAVLVLSFLPFNASAVDISSSVEFVQGVSRPYWQSSNNETKHQGSYNFGPTGTASYGSTNWVRLFDSTGGNLSVASGNFVSIVGTVVMESTNGSNASTNVSSQPMGVWGIGSATSSDGVDCTLIDFSHEDTVTINNSRYQHRFIFEWICRASGGNITNPVTNLWVNGNSSTWPIQLNIQRVTIWETIGQVDLSQVIARINAVNNNITSLNGKIDTTNSKLDSLIEKAEDLADAQEQANQDAQDRYDDEKQTIQDNADSGQQAMEDLQNNTNFSVPNPLSVWFGYFTNGCSTSIPTIASWLNAPSSTYTSWWCTSSKLQAVRNSSTTVLSVIGVCLVFGFCIKWLRTNQGEI